MSKPRQFLAGLLLMLTACGESTTETQPQSQENLAPNSYVFTTCSVFRDEKRVGCGTVTTQGDKRFLITARHLFGKQGLYTIHYGVNGSETSYITALKGDVENDLVVGLLGTKAVQFAPLPDLLSNRITEAVLKGQADMTITKQMRRVILLDEPVLSIASWNAFKAQHVECLECELRAGFSGAGVLNYDTTMNENFWIVSGLWPPGGFTEGLRPASQKTDGKNFTLVSGASWVEILEFYRALLAGEK